VLRLQILAGNKTAVRLVGGGEVMASDAVRRQYRLVSAGRDGGACNAGGQREVQGDCPIW
jgi:hypothetical protein